MYRCKVKILLFAELITSLFMASSCRHVDDDQIPALPVSINLSDIGLWNSFGVSGLGVHRNFIKSLGEPAGYHYSVSTYTGFGGVLLIGGKDPFSDDINVPLAYDLACPVECDKNVRIYIDSSNLEAVCPECGSHYDVLMGGGVAVSGRAYNHHPRFGLRRYECVPIGGGGYFIRD